MHKKQVNNEENTRKKQTVTKYQQTDKITQKHNMSQKY